jgi:hypothetical protein
MMEFLTSRAKTSVEPMPALRRLESAVRVK